MGSVRPRLHRLPTRNPTGGYVASTTPRGMLILRAFGQQTRPLGFIQRVSGNIRRRELCARSGEVAGPRQGLVAGGLPGAGLGLRGVTGRFRPPYITPADTSLSPARARPCNGGSTRH